MTVWLQTQEGTQIPIHGTCSLGRSSRNTVTITGEQASRRHALIHGQSENEFCLVDLGSKNGSYLNGRRVHQPTRLRHLDEIRLGDQAFQFHQPEAPESGLLASNTQLETVSAVRQENCWLMMADIEGFTELSQRIPTDELAQLAGRWILDCSDAILSHGGVVNKYLGDGIFAYWPEAPDVAGNVLAAINRIREIQARPELVFRVVLHFGEVTLGGASAAGEENLIGPEVNYLFRVEKVAGLIQEYLMLSAAAAQRWPDADGLRSVGVHGVRDYEGDHEFFVW